MTWVGNLLTGFVSKDAHLWEERERTTIMLPPDVFIGLCVTSHKNDALTEAKIDAVQVIK